MLILLSSDVVNIMNKCATKLLFFSFDFCKLPVPSSKMVAIYPYKMSGFILGVKCKPYSVQDFVC